MEAKVSFQPEVRDFFRDWGYWVSASEVSYASPSDQLKTYGDAMGNIHPLFHYLKRHPDVP